MRSLFGKLSLSTNPRQLCMSTPISRPYTGTQSSITQCAPYVSPLSSQNRSFSITPKSQARNKKPKAAEKGKGKRKGKSDAPDPRIVSLKLSNSRKIPPPLRFARNRYLRHWTVHRAWQLWLRQQRENEERELSRLYQSMSAACEELRKTSGPSNKAEGYLYRVAMEKKGIYHNYGIPIEYARPQTETPARVPWNHEWTRE